MNALKSTLFHALELTVVILAAFTICNLFNLTNEDVKLVVSIVLSGLVKFARALDASPIPDYVNGPKIDPLIEAAPGSE